MNDMNHAVLQRLNAAGLELSSGWIKTAAGPRWHCLVVSLRKRVASLHTNTIPLKFGKPI